MRRSCRPYTPPLALAILNAASNSHLQILAELPGGASEWCGNPKANFTLSHPADNRGSRVGSANSRGVVTAPTGQQSANGAPAHIAANPITAPNAAAMTRPALEANHPRLGRGSCRKCIISGSSDRGRCDRSLSGNPSASLDNPGKRTRWLWAFCVIEHRCVLVCLCCRSDHSFISTTFRDARAAFHTHGLKSMRGRSNITLQRSIV